MMVSLPGQNVSGTTKGKWDCWRGEACGGQHALVDKGPPTQHDINWAEVESFPLEALVSMG